MLRDEVLLRLRRNPCPRWAPFVVAVGVEARDGAVVQSGIRCLNHVDGKGLAGRTLDALLSSDHFQYYADSILKEIHHDPSALAEELRAHTLSEGCSNRLARELAANAAVLKQELVQQSATRRDAEATVAALQEHQRFKAECTVAFRDFMRLRRKRKRTDAPLDQLRLLLGEDEVESASCEVQSDSSYPHAVLDEP